jgi:Helix-turn-helix domain
MRRRGGRRQQPGSTPADVGSALREAREAAGIGLTELQDRTGVPLPQLEALEAGDISRFPDLRSALTAVRRYGDLVELDIERFAGVVETHWGAPPAGVPGPLTGGVGTANGVPTQSVYVTGSVSAGHLSRYPGDGTHLRAFTQTDEVPGVRRGAPPAVNGNGGSLTVTGSFPAVPRTFAPARTVPLLLRGAIWVTAMLLVVALAGLAVQHYEPQLLADIHLVHHAHPATPATPGGATRSSTPARSAHSSVVSLTNTGVGSATVAVRASNYTVVVAAWAPCWTVVHSPQSFSPVFAGTLQTGQVKDFNSSNGQLTVSMSASIVTVQVKIGGKTVPKWLFKPTTVPFTLNFNSTGS